LSARPVLLALGVTLALASSAAAKPQVFAIDPVHSRVGFTVRHFFTKVSGNFTQFQGQVSYDSDSPAGSGIRAEIDAASITTQNDRRDKHLKSSDFFDVEKFPKITFTSTKVTVAEGGNLLVEGDFTMHGVTKPVTLTVSFIGSGLGGQGEMRAGFEATTRLNRKDYGVLWNRTLDQGGTMLGDDVDIAIAVEGVSPPPTPPAAKEGEKAAK
jgi:polyisoprenoid-binding protein YceI